MIKSERWMEVPVDRLVLADWNYKTNDPNMAESLRENIKRNGQIENILVRELDTGFFEVVNGNHRVVAFRDLEMKDVTVYNLGKVTLAQAQRIAIETNETRFAADSLQLARLIKDIAAEVVDIDDMAMTMPYTNEEIDAMVKMTDFDWDGYSAADSEDGASHAINRKTVVKCPSCGEEFDVKSAPLAKG